MSVAWVGAGIAATGVISSSMSAGKASKAQQQAADQANETQRYQYDTTREDNAPFRESGVQANNRLAYLLGLAPGGTGSAPTRDQLRNELVPQFTSRKTTGRPYTDQEIWSMGDSAGNETYSQYRQESSDVVDEAGLNAAIEARLAQQAQQGASAQTAAGNDPAYGSLMRNFTAADMQADPVHQAGFQFGLTEGTKGINRMASASGGRESGALLKALTRFGNDYASTKGNESFNRFNTNQDKQYNRLAGMSGSGQQATNQVSAAGQSMANNVSQNQLGAGNARAAGYIGQSNALNNGLSQGYNMYQNNQLMSKLFPQQGGVPQQAGVTGWTSQG